MLDLIKTLDEINARREAELDAQYAQPLTVVHHVSEAEFIARLSEIRGAKAVGLTVRTDCRLKKTGNPFGKVFKTATVNVLVNFDYVGGVERRLEAEGKPLEAFEQGESWHAPVKTEDGKYTPFCAHKKTNEFYLRCQLRGKGETTYATEAGQAVTREEIAAFLPKTSGYANQGLDNPLEFIVYKLESILEARVDGEVYVINAA